MVAAAYLVYEPLGFASGDVTSPDSGFQPGSSVPSPDTPHDRVARSVGLRKLQGGGFLLGHATGIAQMLSLALAGSAS